MSTLCGNGCQEGGSDLSAVILFPWNWWMYSTSSNRQKEKAKRKRSRQQVKQCWTILTHQGPAPKPTPKAGTALWHWLPVLHFKDYWQSANNGGRRERKWAASKITAFRGTESLGTGHKAARTWRAGNHERRNSCLCFSPTFGLCG